MFMFKEQDIPTNDEISTTNDKISTTPTTQDNDEFNSYVFNDENSKSSENGTFAFVLL